MFLNLVLSCLDGSGGIGAASAIPWSLPGINQHFNDITLQTSDPAKRNAVIMGRVTWETVYGSQPLQNRENIVVSSSLAGAIADSGVPPEGFLVFGSLFDALSYVQNNTNLIENAFVVGGESTFIEAMSYVVKNVYMTVITQVPPEMTITCDRFFPSVTISMCQTVDVSEPIVENGFEYVHKKIHVRVMN